MHLNQTTFKTDTLVACGFLVGAHPGHLHCDEAERELRTSLQLENNFPLQLSARTTTILIVLGKPEKFSFQAVVIETPINHAEQLREQFYLLPKPAVAHGLYPYTGQ